MATAHHADNTSAIQIASTVKSHLPHNKHIETDCHSISNEYDKKIIALCIFIQLSNLFTKAVAKDWYCFHVHRLMFDSPHEDKQLSSFPFQFCITFVVLNLKLSFIHVMNNYDIALRDALAFQCPPI